MLELDGIKFRTQEEYDLACKDKETILRLVRVEIAFHCRVIEIFSPAHEVIDTHLRTVGIVDFEAVALGLKIVADGFQTVSGLAGKKGRGLLVAVNAGTDEVIGTKITDLKNNIWHHVGNVDKTSRLENISGDGVRGSVSTFCATGRDQSTEGHGQKNIHCNLLHNNRNQQVIIHHIVMYNVQRYTFFNYYDYCSS